MSKSKYSTIKVMLKTKNEGKVGCVVFVKDGYAFAKFSHRAVAKRLYSSEKKKGKDVTYQERHQGFIQKFPGKTKDEVIKIIQEELENEQGK